MIIQLNDDNYELRSCFEYCNDMLRANVLYEVELRAYMITNVAMGSALFSIDGTEVESRTMKTRVVGN
ncbi:hypothetical protein KIN20_005507 [Parelaphostrongylus tenuis]|uniref:Uncharacterized protein n=1 Tax=Parelaphostrongylus tenuis TaxID=148309 RepID=A0AAD5MIT3_PARTN|nr:hypothetical protein KIN20_005507 [Parelaphostrongylus tenuis]